MNTDKKPKSLGEFLKTKRELKKLSLEKFSQLSKIPKKILISIENNDFSKIYDVYLNLYLKRYAEILNLDYSDLQNKVPLKEISFSEKNKKNYYKISKFIINPEILNSIFLIILFLAITIYFIYQLENLFGLPSLKINNPLDDVTIIESNSINIVGKTEKDNILKINNELTNLQDNGIFEKTINIHEGINIIKIEAISPRGKTNSAIKMIIK